MQRINLPLAIVFSLINRASAASSSRILGNALGDALGSDGMVEVHFQNVDPEVAIGDALGDAMGMGFHGVAESSLDNHRSTGHPAKTLEDRDSDPEEFESFFDKAAHLSTMMLPDRHSGPQAFDLLDEPSNHGRDIHILPDNFLGSREVESLFDKAITNYRGLRGHSRGSRFAGRPKSASDDIMMSGEFPIPPASISAITLRNLFPGPGIMIEEDAPAMPFGTPDMAVMDMLQQMDDSFARDLLPMAHRAASAGKTPDSCGPEIREYCRRAPSQLHCLGQHSDQISDKCRTDVGKSVPFLCSEAIDKWCNLLEKGILDCLGGKLQNLEEDCHDAVVATRHVIARSSTQRASVLNPTTGLHIVNVPSVKKAKQQREARVDAPLSNITSSANKAPVAPQPPQIDAKHFDKQAATSGTGTYKGDLMTNSTLLDFVGAIFEKSSLNFSSQDIAKTKGEPEAKGLETAMLSQLQSEEGALFILFLVAVISMALLRSQRITKLIAKHDDPAVRVPSVHSRSVKVTLDAQQAGQVDQFVVASGSVGTEFAVWRDALEISEVWRDARTFNMNTLSQGYFNGPCKDAGPAE